MKKLLYTFILTSLSLNVLQSQKYQFENISYIEVQGMSERKIEPDEIYINIYLNENDSKGKESVALQEKKLFKVIEKLGINKKNLVLTGGSSRYTIYILRKNINNTFKNYELKTSSALEASKVLYELDLVKVHHANIGRVEHSQKEKIKNEVRLEALKAAKKNAQQLTAAIGSTIGKPLVIKDKNYYAAPQYSKTSSISLMKTEANSNAYNDSAFQGMNFRKITIRSIIYASFEIK